MTNDADLSNKNIDKRLAEGDAQKIDDTLDDLEVSKGKAGNDQSQKPDTEGSTSSSKDLGEG